MIKTKNPFDKSRSQFKTKNQFDKRIHFVPINHQFRINNSPNTLSTCCSTKNSSSSASGCSSSCQCSSKCSSNESRQSRLKMIKRIRKRQRISYILIFIIILICFIVLILIIKNTTQLDDIINYFKYTFYSPTPLINEATRKSPQSFTGKPITWTDEFDKD